MELLATVARKRGPADRIVHEAMRTEWACEVASRTGLFDVPAVVRLDAANGVLETERLADLVTLSELALRGDPRLPALCERAGRALAAVHASAPPEAALALPRALRGTSDIEVAIHGDFTGSNVAWRPSLDRLVILDWSAAPAIGVPATQGTACFDVLWFVLFFFRTEPFPPRRSWQPTRWARAFLHGYGEGLAMESDSLVRYFEDIAPFLRADRDAEQARRGRGLRAWPYRAWRARGWARGERFLRLGGAA